MPEAIETPPHVSVLKEEVVRYLAPRRGGRYVDATLGGGGHAEALLDAAGGEATLLGLDWDEAALEIARARLARFAPAVRLFRENFADLPALLAREGVGPLDGLLADLGLSSMHLAGPRGFSFLQEEGPLDMRMDPRLPRSAADLLAEEREDELARIFYELGEERRSRAAARAIVRARVRRPVRTVGDLKALLGPVLGRAHPGLRIHPATRIFQALRIAVNREMENLDRLLADAPGLLAPGGRLVVLSFHSLEDRKVKQALRAGRGSLWDVLTPKPVRPTPEEAARNPRSRSARLRAAERRPQP